MSKIAGVETEINAHGEITFVTFDVKKHKETIMPVLEKLGIVEKVKMEKWLTVEEARAKSLKHLDELWKK